ncbi:WYL domain-containing protein [bacterium]|nr:WYL domain-containing protein [bacterium]
MAQRKLREILHLTQALQASSYGLSYDEMRDKLAHNQWGQTRRPVPSERTIQRMIKTLREDLDVDVKECVLDDDHHFTKRFRIDNLPSAVLALDKSDTAEIKRHITTLPDGLLSQALTKVVAGAAPLSGGLKATLDELIERTAHTATMEPRSIISKTQMSLIETSIEGRTEIKFKYRSQTAKKASVRTVKPLGLLYGRFGYLCAATASRGAAIYRLDLLEDVQATNTPFEPNPHFNFKAWASESFGIYHGDELIKVKLRFSKAVASRAAKITFHSSQQMTPRSNGELTLTWKCRGHREMIWQLLHPDFVGEVEIEEPSTLKDEYREYLERAKLAVA